jgi:hypothetical protein
MRLENCFPFGRLWSPVVPLRVQRAFNAGLACIPRAIKFCIAMKLLLGDVIIDCKTSEARQEMSPYYHLHMWIFSHTLPLTPSVELTCRIPCQQSLHVGMRKI